MANVLVVEDERVSAEETAAIVRSSGHHLVGVVASAESALDVASRFPTDLALVDIGIRGGLDGVSLAEQLQSNHGVAVVFVTGHGEQKMLDRAKRTAPYGYVLKPFDARTLEASVEIALTRHQADQNLRAHGEWLSQLLTSIGVAVIATDNDGVIRFANPLAQSLCGTGLLDAPASQCFNLRDTRTGERFDPVAAALEADTPVEFHDDIVLQRPDGGEVMVEGSAVPSRGTEGGGRSLVIAFRDMSDRLEVARERQRRDRLEALATLSAGIAHDFNNLLAIIMNSAALGRRFPEASPRVRELFADIESSADRASTLTTQLATFAKGGSATPRTHQLEPILRHSLMLALRGSATECDYRIDPGLWKVRVDEGQISQVFTNLALNARDAMNNSGQIEVSVRNLAIGPGEDPLLLPGHYVEVSLVDHGVGIPPEHVEHIFDPYFTTKSTGRGLGLASAYGIVRRHSGALRVESREGRGAKLRVILPASDEPEPVGAAIPEPAHTAYAEQGRILVMDDEPQLRKILSDCLVELGYHVESAPEGDTAIDIYRRALAAKQPFDLVILDLTVRNGKGGVETLSGLSSIDPNVRAIATSGYSDSNVLEHHASHGFAGALPKPYAFAKLAILLRQLLGPPFSSERPPA